MLESGAEMSFSDDEVRTPAGLERWRALMGEAVLKLDLELLAESPFVSEVRAIGLPDVGIARARKSGLRMVRAAGHADGDDSISLHVATSGCWRLAQRGKHIDLRPGSAALVLNDEAALVECPTLTTSICVQFPRRALEGRTRGALDRVMHPRSNEALKLLVGYLDLLTASPPRDAPLARVAASHVLDLVALVVAPERDERALAEEGGVRAAWLERLESYVRHNATRHDLSVHVVAAHHRITPRYVQRLFEAAGKTFSNYLLEVRLEGARRHLVDPARAHWSIAAVAYDAGFSDISYFNRAFKRRYGVRPSDVRAGATSTS